jgi:hypothetical protein
MTKFVEMDDRVTLNTNGPKHWPVILINEINVNPKDIDQFLKAWTKDAAIMKEQPYLFTSSRKLQCQVFV